MMPRFENDQRPKENGDVFLVKAKDVVDISEMLA